MKREVEFEPLSSPPTIDELWEEAVDQEQVDRIHEGFADLLADQPSSKVVETEVEPETGSGLISELGRTGLAASFLATVTVYKTVAKVCRIDSSGIF